MSKVRNKNKENKKPKPSPNRSTKKPDEEESKSSVESKDLSALGGGNMRNPSSSDPSSDYSDNIPEPKPKSDENTGTLGVNKPKTQDKRPSIQFLEQLNLTDAEIENLDIKKKIVPIHFGTEERIK